MSLEGMDLVAMTTGSRAPELLRVPAIASARMGFMVTTVGNLSHVLIASRVKESSLFRTRNVFANVRQDGRARAAQKLIALAGQVGHVDFRPKWSAILLVGATRLVLQRT
jgi:hypothetical protein